MARGKRYEEAFKKQIVALYNGGKSLADINKEYGIAKSTVKTWVERLNNSGSLDINDNRTEEEKELIALRKRVKQLEMENDIFKASSANTRQKVDLIISNRDKYSISAMCKFLKVPRSLVYYHINNRQKANKTSKEEVKLENAVIRIFRESRNNYGTRKIKKQLEREGIRVSRRKIGHIMKKYALVSNYTVAQYKVSRQDCNEERIANTVNREFKNRDKLEVVVSDLTYVRVNGQWSYICVLLDLHNKGIIGYSVGKNKTAELKAFLNCRYPLTEIKIFHTDRGNEFKNKLIDEVIDVFGIERSLSNKGCPYDNAVAESLYNILKTEFIKGNEFDNLEHLYIELADYINWYNNHRLHGSLNYLTPMEYKEKASESNRF
ncbi:MAG: IS3 family transposase [Clostridia bacterium]